jgi:pyruvate,orthophosphate dikinase
MFLAWNDKPKKSELTKENLGGKGFGLFEMQKLGVPVPEFVVIPTTLCVEYMAKPAETTMKVKTIAKEIVDRFTKELGYLPLLSVRSGARVSMPGMMDTILNVGTGDEATVTYCTKLGTRAAADCRRRFLHMFGTTALGLPNSDFETDLENARAVAGVSTDAELSTDMLLAICDSYVKIYKDAGHKVPASAREQVELCILAVMNSWNSERAVAYREHNNIPNDWGTAVVIQRMVFGNMNDDSSSGVAFSRDPSTGSNELTGEFLPNAQGEDVVAGIRTPKPLTELPESVLDDLCNVSLKLEKHFHDMLDMEFTVEDGKLYMLQVRVAKRSARAWVRSSLDFHHEGLIDRDTVFERISRDQVKLLTQPVIDPSFKVPPHLTGIPGCAGVAVGRAAFTVERAVAYKAEGHDCILLRYETTPEDIKGMFASVGIVTATGGHTSHAAVVARGMDKVCVTGCSKMREITSQHATIVSDDDESKVYEGAKVTVDGTTGRIWFDIDVPVTDPTDDTDVADLVAFVNGTAGVVDVALPLSPGVVYKASQFLSDVPAPISKEILMIEDLDNAEDLVLTMMGDNFTDVAADNLAEWIKKHGITKVTMFTDKGPLPNKGPFEFVHVPKKDTLDSLMARPVTQDDIEAFFKGSLTSVRKLLEPQKLEDKFKIIGCQRHRLLTAFK